MEAQAIAYTANYASVVFKIMIECLEKNGALRPGQVQTALRATIAHPDIGSTMCCSPGF